MMGDDGVAKIERKESISDASVVEEEAETDPALLKNTPSNIRRLADEIEQFEGRRKYLAQTRSPSDGGDVRWYFCKVPLGLNRFATVTLLLMGSSWTELAASIPRVEVVGKGEYFRFGMRDSLAIEAAFLQREEELLSYWWREYAECSEGPKGQTGSTTVDLQKNPLTSELYVVEEERVGVPVKGGLYEVDLVKRHCFPVYWNGENRRVLRGHWFAQSGGLDWLPLREDVAEQLEFAYRRQVWHRRTFQPSGLFAARVELQGYTPGLHALFTGEDDTWEAWLNVDASGFSTIINFGGNGVKLRRGYAASPSPKPTQDELRQQKEEEMDDYCSEWRKGLKLSGESAVEKITLDGVRGLRTTLSATVHDVLYYMSPIYCQEIIDSVSNQLNRLYLKFLKRNPGYDGKVSLYGHSLGSVLSYDILCHQENLSSPFPMEFMYTKHDKEDETAENISKMPSEVNSMDDGTRTFQETSNEDKSGGHHVPSLLENVDSEDCLVSDISPTSFTIRDESSTLKVSEMQAGTKSSAEDGQDHLCSPSDVCPEENGTLSEACDVNCDTTENLEANTNLDNLVNPDASENVAEPLQTSDTSDEHKTIQDLKSEVEFLKARVAQLEAQLGCNDTSSRSLEGSHEVHPGTSNQDESKKILTSQNDLSTSYKPFIKYTKLEFKVHTFFAAGSPLGVFLSIRNVRIGIGEGREYWGEENINEEMPACQQMFNIFHPFDPVAYRIEPLVCKEYISKRPVIIPYHKGGKRLHIGLQEFAEDFAARSESFVKHLNSVKVQVLTVCQSKKDRLEEEVEDVNEEVRSYGSYMMERLTGSEDGRIDHVLQDKTFQHSYISAIGAHTNYWRDHDTALFVLNHLYRDIPEYPDQPKHQRSKTKNDSVSNRLPDTKDIAEEELPLTFSSSNLIKKSPKKTNTVR
uniref:DDHD domain-containing protein n=1 Tax=Chenopodium quinoa TaxID=63459 RepID=A0A803M2A9_CHEQI